MEISAADVLINNGGFTVETANGVSEVVVASDGIYNVHVHCRMGPSGGGRSNLKGRMRRARGADTVYSLPATGGYLRGSGTFSADASAIVFVQPMEAAEGRQGHLSGHQRWQRIAPLDRRRELDLSPARGRAAHRRRQRRRRRGRRDRRAPGGQRETARRDPGRSEHADRIRLRPAVPLHRRRDRNMGGHRRPRGSRYRRRSPRGGGGSKTGGSTRPTTTSSSPAPSSRRTGSIGSTTAPTTPWPRAWRSARTAFIGSASTRTTPRFSR